MSDMKKVQNSISGIELAKNTLETYLKTNNFRTTSQRFELLELALSYKKHFTADDLYNAVKGKVSRATVYNTLELFVKCNLFFSRNLGDNIARYEPTPQEEKLRQDSKHDHIICTDCDKIYEFYSESIYDELIKICEQYNLDLQKYSLNIYARCKKRD